MKIIRLLKNLVKSTGIACLLLGTILLVLTLFLKITGFAPDRSPQTKSSYISAQERTSERISASVKAFEGTEYGEFQTLIMKTVYCQTMGELCDAKEKYVGENFDRSTIGGLTEFMVLPYQVRPASGITYVADVFENAGFVPRTYAAEGIGFSQIKGFLPIWKIFRDIAYLFMVLVIIVIGFMIMFNKQLSPETVITAQSALPRIAVALLLITFSFAIAGFMIDLMYTGIAIVIYLMTHINPQISGLQVENTSEMINRYFGAKILDLYPYSDSGTLYSVANSLFEVLPGLLRGVLKTIISTIVGVWLVRLWDGVSLSGIVNGLKLQIFGGNSAAFPVSILHLTIIMFLVVMVVKIIPALIISIFLFITLISFIFRLFFMLLSAYIRLLLLIIFAPFLLMFHALPGKNIFGWWFKSLFGEVILFPFVILISLVGFAIVNTNIAGVDFRLPFLYGINSADFGAIVGMGIVLLTPELFAIVKAMLGIQEMPISAGLGTFFGGASGIQEGVHSGTSMVHSAQILTSMPIIKNQDWAKKLVARVIGTPHGTEQPAHRTTS